MMSRSSMVDRQGAAQGMAEVISAFSSGTELVIQQAVAFTMDATNDPAMRDGYIRLFNYLPTTLGERFVPYIETVVPSILASLADETEYLRNSALHAGQILISTYSLQAKRYLLPSLLDGVISEAWRIRQAAVTLIGDMLFNLSGISGKMTSETSNEDETMGLESVNKTIVRQVGQKTRDEIIVALYIARFDSSVHVRQAGGHVWKLVVSNTPRTVRDALPSLFALIVHCMATSTEDRAHMGRECLAEVVRKLNERVMPQLMAEVQTALDDARPDYRRGAMQALSTIIVNAPSESLLEYEKLMVRAFRHSLCAPDHVLRQVAGETFAVYYNKVGIGALEAIVDPLFSEYASNESEQVLDGIVAILSVNKRGRVLTVPSLVNRVLAFRSKTYVLSRLSDVIGETIERNFLHIFQTLLGEGARDASDEFYGHCATLLRCLQSTYTIVGAAKFFSQRGIDGDVIAARLLAELVRLAGVREDLLSTFVDGCMLLYTAEAKEVNAEAARLLNALVAKCSANEAMDIPAQVSAFAVGMREERRVMHGLTEAAHWRPFTELLSVSSRAGTLIQRERTLHAVGDMLDLATSNAALRPIAPSIVAILLRLLADQCPPTLKHQAVRAVHLLVHKAPEVMRAFAPQLTNFMKRLQQEYEESASLYDISSLLELTQATLSEVQLLLVR